MVVPTLSEQQVNDLRNQGRVLVMLHNTEVYDVTEFLPDHPGGDDLIREFANTDVTSIMADEDTHSHSEAAYTVLDEYLIGRLPTGESESETEESYAERERRVTAELHKDTDPAKDFQDFHFLDLSRPLIPQVWKANWTRDFYIEQIHRPRHYKYGSAPLFGNFLEPISKTSWWVIPMIWIPVNMYVISIALRGIPAFAFLPLYVFGLCLWTLVEYLLHRFLFHLDYSLPEYQTAYLLHFLMHGVHHYLPMDQMRLVMPPALFFVIATPLYFLCHAVFRHYYVSQAIFAGAHMGYVLYDCTHYFIHHMQLPGFMKETKKNHLDHHYKDYEMGFGVTSKFWDRVFGTELVDTSRSRFVD